MIQLGDKVKDIVTGFEGIAVSRLEYLNGCVRFGLEAQGVKKGEKPEDPSWFDAHQLRVTKAAAVNIRKAETGGPGLIPPPLPTPH